MLQPKRDRERRENPIVYLDIRVGDRATGRLTIELRADVVPTTAENFRRLCTGETLSSTTGKRRFFAHTPVHRVVKDKFCQAGDFENHDGSGGECALDNDIDAQNEDSSGVPVSNGSFADENFILRHTGPGVLSMVNSGPDSNRSQFYIHFRQNPHLDNLHVVFGVLLGADSFQVLKEIHEVATARGDPKLPVRITQTGQLYPN